MVIDILVNKWDLLDNECYQYQLYHNQCNILLHDVMRGNKNGSTLFC